MLALESWPWGYNKGLCVRFCLNPISLVSL